jgi:hypothetical protein
MNVISIRPVQLILIIRALGGICILEVPAKSAPAYEHQLQQNATIRGSNLPFFFFLGLEEVVVF